AYFLSDPDTSPARCCRSDSVCDAALRPCRGQLHKHSTGPISLHSDATVPAFPAQGARLQFPTTASHLSAMVQSSASRLDKSAGEAHQKTMACWMKHRKADTPSCRSC